MTLREFIQDTQGKIIALPNGRQKGQCVSLVQQYLLQVYNIPFKARGHAKDFGKNLVKEGLAREVDKARYGDLVVFQTGDYGHIGIIIDDKKMYDQNNGTHDDYKAGYSYIFNIDKKYYRIKSNEWKVGDYKLLVAKAVRKTHNLGNNIQIVGLMKQAKPYCTSNKFFDKAFLKVGSECKISQIYIDETSRVWGAFGKYWIVLCNNDGTPQAEYIGD